MRSSRRLAVSALVLFFILALGWRLRPARQGERAPVAPAQAGGDSGTGLKPEVSAVPGQEQEVPREKRPGGNPPEVRHLSYAGDWGRALPPELAAFRDWVVGYNRASDSATRAALEPAGLALAQARRPVMRRLIASNPQAALAATVPAEVANRLPPAIRLELERRFSTRGNFNVFVFDYPLLELIRRKQAGLPTEVYTRTVEIAGNEYQTFVYGRRAHQTTKLGIPLHGLLLDGVVALHEAPLRLLDPGEVGDAGSAFPAELAGRVNEFESVEAVQRAVVRLQVMENGLGPQPHASPADPALAVLTGGSVPETAAAPATAWTIGQKQVLVLRVDFSDLTGEPRRGTTTYTQSYVQNLADTLIAPYYAQSSYGQTALTHTVSARVYRMPKTAVEYATSSTGNTTLHADARSAAAADFTVAAFDRIIVLFSPLSGISGSRINYGGLAQVGASNIWVNGYFDFRVVAHEIGHTYGLFHANLWQVSDGNALSANGSSTEYGDDYDTMGANYANDRRTDFNPWFKNLLGWAGDSQVQTISTNGTFRINRFDNSTGSGTLALKIPRDITHSYWIGVRRSFTTNAAMQQGAYVMWGYSTNRTSNLLDLTTPGVGVGDAALAPGIPLVDPTGNVSFRPVANGGTAPNEYLDVQVTLGLNGLPVFTAQPQSQGYVMGATVTLSATVTGTAPLSFQWRKDGADLPGANSNNLTIANARATDAGVYTLYASNAVGAALSEGAVIGVNSAPILTTQPLNTAAASGRTVALRLAAGGFPTPAIQWRKNGSPLNGATTATLSFSSVQAADAGTYYAVLTNDLGTAQSRTVTLTVFPSVTPPSNDAFANAWTLVGDAGVATGTNVGATGEALEPTHINTSGTATSVWYRWTPTVDGVAQIDTIGSTFDTVLAVYTGAVVGALTKVGEADDGGGLNTSLLRFPVSAGTTYSVAVGDFSSLRAGGSIALRYGAYVFPTITTPPANRVASLGGTASFSVEAVGTELTFQWYRNGVPLANATGATLSLANLQPGDGGSYYVAVSNIAGTVFSAVATLTSANAAPTITVPPTAVAATAGGTAAMTVTATGLAPLSYQWRRNGIPIPGATDATLGFTQVSRIDADGYDVVVTSGLTPVTSPVARLTVAPVAYPTLVSPDPDWELRPESSGGVGYGVFPLADGRAYLAGSFVSIDGVRRVGLARIDVNGLLDSTFIPTEIDGPVRAVAAQPDGRVIIGGEFVRINGLLRNRIARLNADGSVDTRFDPGAGADGNVYAVAVQSDGKILVGGVFLGYANTTRDFLVRLNSDGTLDTGFLTRGMSSTVYALAVQGDGRILVGGGFSAGYRDINGALTTRVGLARLNGDGTLDTAYNPAPNSAVYALALQSDGRCIIGGTFTQVGLTAVGRIARLGLDGALDSTFNNAAGAGIAGGTTPTVNALALHPDGRVVVGGSFSTYGGVASSNLVRLLSTGARDSGFLSAGMSFPAYAVGVLANEQVVVGGGFASYLNAAGVATARSRFARLNTDGTLASGYNFAVRTAGSINALVPLPGGKLLVAGYFTTLRGVNAPVGVARVNPDGTVDPSFNSGGSGANSNVYAALAQPDGGIVITGALSSYNGTLVPGIARLKSDGKLDPAFNPGTGLGGGYGYTLGLLAAGRIFVGGTFTTVNGVSRNRVAVLHGSGVLETSFDPGTGANGSVYASALLPDGKVIIGGAFTTYNQSVASRLARLLSDGKLDTSFPTSTGANSSVYAVTSTASGSVYAGGAFTAFGSSTREGLVRLTATGAVDSAFLPPGLNNVQAIHVQENSAVIVRGSFPAAGTEAGTAFLARLDSNGTRDATFVAGGFTNLAATPSVLVMSDTGQLFMQSSGATGMSASEAAVRPVISTQPVGGNVAPGGSITLAVVAGSPLPVSYQWRRDNQAVPGATSASLLLTDLQAAQAGTYTVVITSELGAVTSSSAVVSVGVPAGVLVRGAARAEVGAAEPIVGAFTLEGVASRPILLRAVGPTLSVFGVAAPLADPWLDVHDATSGQIVGANDDWSLATNSSQIAAASLQVGAFGLAGGSRDAALLLNLAPGTYRTRTAGAGSSTGTVLLETYAADSTPRLVYLGMQGPVGGGTNAFVLGFAIAAPQAGRSYLVRALGLRANSPLVAFDPTLSIISGSAVIATNDNWGGDAALAAASVTAGAMPLPAGSTDAAALFEPTADGGYTVQVSGIGPGAGTVWVEVFEVDPTRAATAPAAVVSNPLSVSISMGETAVLRVVATGRPAPTFQWRKNSGLIAGATASTLILPAAQTTDSGVYSVLVVNTGGTAISDSASVTVAPPLHHTADRDANMKISLLELTRVIELFNTRNGTTRTGCYRVDATGEDGFNPESTRSSTAVVALTAYHNADSGRDGKISLLELTRVIELFNYRSGTTRTGQYHVQAGTEDGFNPGP